MPEKESFQERVKKLALCGCEQPNLYPPNNPIDRQLYADLRDSMIANGLLDRGDPLHVLDRLKERLRVTD